MYKENNSALTVLLRMACGYILKELGISEFFKKLWCQLYYSLQISFAS